MLKYHPYKSDKLGKKYYIITECSRKIYFGASGYNDFTIHKDEQRKQRYIDRHKIMNDDRCAIPRNYFPGVPKGPLGTLPTRDPPTHTPGFETLPSPLPWVGREGWRGGRGDAGRAGNPDRRVGSRMRSRDAGHWHVTPMQVT
jgi:hypothetical protein